MPLGAGASYQLTEGLNKHEGNHYAATTTIEIMQKIAKAYVKAVKGTVVLGVNDMSLEKGGLFDIFGQWTHPHRSHRDGKDTDIDRCHPGATPCNASKPSNFVKQGILWGIIDSTPGTSLRLEKDKGEPKCIADVANQSIIDPTTKAIIGYRICRMHIDFP